MAELLPLHYFEKAPVVRVIWELWISIKLTYHTTNASAATTVDKRFQHQHPQMKSSSIPQN